MDIGLLTVFILTIFFIFSFMFGKNWNYKIQKRIWKEISPVIRELLLTRKVSFRSLGSSAFQILIPKPPIKSIKRIELTLLLLDRENILHYLFQKFLSKKTDEILIKAEFIHKPKNTFELLSKLKSPSLNYRYEVDNEYIPGKYLISQNLRFTKNLLSSIKPLLMSLKDLILYISVSNETPHLTFRVKYNSHNLRNIINLCIHFSRL